MFIGHFLAHYPQPGGTTTMVDALSAALIGLGHRVVVFRKGSPGGRSRPAPEPALETVELTMPDQPWAPLVAFGVPEAEGLSQVAALDVLVVHGAFSPSSAIAAWYARSAGTPYVVCPHDPYSPELFQQRPVLKTLYWHLVERRLIREGAMIHILAPSHADYLAARNVVTPWFCVPNGYVAPRNAPDLPRSRRGGPVRALYLGRMDVHNKGIDLLLAAVEDVNTRGADVTLTLVGRATPSEASRLRRMLGKGMQQAISYAGPTSSAADAILNHDITVLPSRFDGFGQVVIESLALGRPVLVSAKAGVSEYLQGYSDAVICVQPTRDTIADGLRQAVGRIEKMTACAEERKADLAAEFKWSRIAQRWADVLGEVGDSKVGG